MSLLKSTVDILRRSLHVSSINRGLDLREKRIGHLKKTDNVEGERSAFVSSSKSFELIDDNLMDTVIGHSKFKDIPVMHIICTRNNTKMAICEPSGKRIALKTAGSEGFKNCRKGTTVAAQAVAKRIVTFTKDHSLNDFRLVFNGLGPGRDAVFKVIETSGLNIVSLSDRTEAIEPWIRRPRKAKRI